MFPPRIRLSPGPRWLLYVAAGMGWYYLLMLIGVVFDDMATLRIGPYTLQKVSRALQTPSLHLFALAALAFLLVWALAGWSREHRTAPKQS